ncbi:MAG: esterase/lipase family protein [Myxococcaceae bacterium]
MWLSLLVLAVTALLAAGGYVIWRKRRGRSVFPRVPVSLRKPAPRNAVVLAHGVMGFESIGLGGIKQEYFRGIAPKLRTMGAEVYTVRVSAIGSITARAQQLAEAVQQIPADHVNIIAHSMGGLDARYAISRLGLQSKVISLTTIGTPHQGTPLADIGTHLLGEKLGMRRIMAAMGVELSAFYDCTTPRMNEFNRLVPNIKGISYASYVGSLKGRWPRINTLLLPAYLYLTERKGENDGIVPAVSQPWGDVLGALSADHWAQIGWSMQFDAPEFYAELFRELRGRGL